jgi:hypothetical protein
MIRYQVAVTDNEARLLQTLRALKFGELYGMEISAGEVTHVMEINGAERSLICEIRNGLQYISILHVHEGSPTIAQVDQKLNGFKCRKKIKFPTE